MNVYRTVTAGTGVSCSDAAAPPGAVAVPVTAMFAVPPPTASNSTAASSPVPATPVASVVRTIAMSMRPVAASTICVNVACAPPARMKLPSCTARTRNAAGLKVMVNDNPDSRDELVAEIATVYGPPPTRKSVPGGVTMTCAPAGATADGDAVGAAGGAPPAAGGNGAPPCTAGAGAAVTAVVPGTGELPGGMIETPGAAFAAPPGGTTFGAGGCAGAGCAPGGGAGAAGAAGAGSGGVWMSGGGPFRPRFCCVPMKIG